MRSNTLRVSVISYPNGPNQPLLSLLLKTPLQRPALSGSHRSTHIASDLASRTLASQAKLQRESPSHKHFASLDLKKHADVSHRRPTL